jgi:hypothetical protein
LSVRLRNVRLRTKRKDTQQKEENNRHLAITTQGAAK